MSVLSPPPKMQFLGDDGLPLSGGQIYTYEKDTTTPLATYTDSTGSSANSNPIVLDTQGRANIWLQVTPYSFVIYNSLGVLQTCSGPIEFPPSALSGSDIPAYSDIVVYNFPDLVAGSDGYTYRCVGTNILDDDPVGSVTGAWVNLSSIASVNLTGTPTAPTAAVGTNTTQIATCAFVLANGDLPTISATVPIAGNIYGGNITRTGANTLTISPCSCLDSTGKIKLYTGTNKTITNPTGTSWVADTIYHIFMVRLVADSSVEFRAYTTEAAAASDVQINAYRWRGFWRTVPTGTTLVLAMLTGNKMLFQKSSENVVSTGITTSFASVTHSALIPESRIAEIEYGSSSAGVTALMMASDDGTNISFNVALSGAGTAADTSLDAWGASAYHIQGLVPYLSTRQFKTTTSTMNLLIHQVIILA